MDTAALRCTADSGVVCALALRGNQPVQGLNCPILHCRRKSKTERAKDCLRVHLQYSKDEDHKDIYIPRYSETQRASATVYACSICRRTFEKKSGLNRHYESIHRAESILYPPSPFSVRLAIKTQYVFNLNASRFVVVNIGLVSDDQALRHRAPR